MAARQRLRPTTFTSIALLLISIQSGPASSSEPDTFGPASATEPLIEKFSPELAARSLDASALEWQKVNRCSQCHANLMYLVARPALAPALPPPTEVREMYEALVRDRWDKKGLRYPSEAMVVAMPLALNDRQTSGKLHNLTRKALDRMLTHQRGDGGWNGIGGANRTYIHEYEETLLAGIAIAAAPGDYAAIDAAKKALDGIRAYSKARPATNPYQKAMLLWTARHVDGLLDDDGKRKAAAEILALQRGDGGWSLPRLGPDEDTKDFKGGKFADKAPSDGYGTGFVVFAARQAGVPADDKRIQRGISWLKANQRASGRWFTPTLNSYTKQNLTSNSGTAFAVLALESCGELLASKAVTNEQDWPQFRGPDGQGISMARGLPTSWSEKENIAWKSPIPGLGWSSPVIRREQIWLTTAIDGGRSLRAVCLDRATGKQVHDVEVFAVNTPGTLHSTNSHATPTPILEGDRIYVHFGSYGTACLSAAGKVLWTTKLPYKSGYGPSSTPVFYKDLLIVPCHGTDVCYTVALDKETGKERWKQTHKGRNSEATPLLIQTPESDQLICNLSERLVAYDPSSGKELWSVSQGNNYAQVPRPLFGHGLVFTCGGYFTPAVQAVKPDGKGDVTKSHVVWTHRKAVPQNPSPLLVGDELFLVNDAGIASCLDAKTGKVHWDERIGGDFYASPLYADGRVYFFNTDGVTTVIASSTMFQKLATNKLDGKIMASPAALDRAIYLRTDHHLYRIEKP